MAKEYHKNPEFVDDMEDVFGGTFAKISAVLFLISAILIIVVAYLIVCKGLSNL